MQMGDADIVQMHLSQALTRVTDADARNHIEAALTELRTPNQESITTCPWCGARGVPSRLATHDCPNTPSDESDAFDDGVVSTTLDLDYADDHATVAVASHGTDDGVGAALAIGTGLGDIRVTLTEPALIELHYDLAAIVDDAD